MELVKQELKNKKRKMDPDLEFLLENHERVNIDFKQLKKNSDRVIKRKV